MSFYVCMSCDEEMRETHNDLTLSQKCTNCGSPYLRVSSFDEEQKAADEYREKQEQPV